MHNIYIYILVMAGVTYLIRMLPLALAKKEITNPFVKSFLFYVPYACLAAMTFPAILNVTSSPLAGSAAMVIGLLGAWFGLGLLPVSLLCCGSVLILQAIL